jgi:hypothetical protein
VYHLPEASKINDSCIFGDWNKRGGGRVTSPLGSPFRLFSVYCPVFFACGLNVVRGERTRPVVDTKSGDFASRAVLRKIGENSMNTR